MLVADLHLEKASWFARLGQFLPPYDFAGDADRTGRRGRALAARPGSIASATASTTASAATACPAARASLLLSLTARLDWVWIIGNHDPGFADHCGGRLADEVEAGGIVLRHEAVAADPRPEISGHFHPKLRLHLRGRSVSRRCFVASNSKLILPAFGSLTGGLDAHHPEIARKTGPGAVGAGARRRPPAAIPDRRLGEPRLHQSAHHIADQEAVA